MTRRGQPARAIPVAVVTGGDIDDALGNQSFLLPAATARYRYPVSAQQDEIKARMAGIGQNYRVARQLACPQMRRLSAGSGFIVSRYGIVSNLYVLAKAQAESRTVRQRGRRIAIR